MLETEKRISVFKVKEIWFADHLFDVKGCHSVTFTLHNKDSMVDGFKHWEVKTLVIDLTQDLDQIWGGFSKKSCRYQIHRAERDGVKVGKSDDYDGFNKLNHAFRNMKGIAITVDDDYIRNYGTLFMATIDGAVVAGQIYIEDKDNIRWLLGASKRLEDSNPLIGCANRALIWEAIRYAKQKGIQEFDFGGYYTGRAIPTVSAVNFFKESFGGVVVTRHVYNKNYSWLYSFAQHGYARMH